MRLSRAKFLRHFANRVACLVAMEAFGGSQHWTRQLQGLGHEVRIMPAKMVRPFVRGNKNDTHDARAIWTAVQQPSVRYVAVKTEEQQAVLALHRTRRRAGMPVETVRLKGDEYENDNGNTAFFRASSAFAPLHHPFHHRLTERLLPVSKLTGTGPQA